MLTVNKCIITILFLLFLVPIRCYSEQIGTIAPAFSLVDLNGRVVMLEQFKGKVVFLAFWAPWCIPCRQEMPELDELYKKFHNEGLEVIGISIDASEKNVAAFLKKVPLGFHVVIDKKNAVSDAYRVSSLPTGFIIGRHCTIHRVYKGFSAEFLPIYEKEIETLLKE